MLEEDWWESSGELFRHLSVKKVPTNTNISHLVKLNVLLKVVLVYVMKFVIYLVGIFLGRTKNTFHTTIITSFVTKYGTEGRVSSCIAYRFSTKKHQLPIISLQSQSM